MVKINYKYDVVVIGAGPVGICFSIKLAKGGFRVLVIEEDPEIGKPRFCTGLISKEAFDKFELPSEAIEGEFTFANLFSPLGSVLHLGGKNIKVYAVDRAAFDQRLYHKAKELGVNFLLNSRCVGIKVSDSGVEEKIIFNGAQESVKSELVVLSTGIKYSLHSRVGLGMPKDFLDCSQVQLDGEGDSGIEIFVGNNIAPHSFAWVVPLKNKQLRVGVSTHRNSPVYLKEFLKNLHKKGRIKNKSFNIVRRPIPLGAIDKTFSQRVLVVGDAAGQVKPTTGGGVYFGLICADLAAKTAIEAFRKNNFSASFLRRYEASWKKEIDFDLTMGLYIRKLLANFKDEQIERLVQFCSQEQIQALIRKNVDFNHHGKLIKELIKIPTFWKNLYQMIAIK